MMQLGTLINQSFQIFNVYGKQPEAVSAIIQGFSMALEEFEIDDITAAFKRWMKDSSVFPTPAEIRKIVVDRVRHRREMARQEENREIIRETMQSAVPAKGEKAPEVPWAFLQWSKFTDEHKRLLPAHLDNLGAKAWGYIKYLYEHAGAPSPSDPMWDRWRKSSN